MSGNTKSPILGDWRVLKVGNKLPDVVAAIADPPPDVAARMRPGEQCLGKICRVAANGDHTGAIANLIAASPAMLEALNDLVAIAETLDAFAINDPDAYATLEMAKIAIRTAMGLPTGYESYFVGSDGTARNGD